MQIFFPRTPFDTPVFQGLRCWWIQSKSEHSSLDCEYFPEEDFIARWTWDFRVELFIGIAVLAMELIYWVNPERKNEKNSRKSTLETSEQWENHLAFEISKTKRTAIFHFPSIITRFPLKLESPFTFSFQLLASFKCLKARKFCGIILRLSKAIHDPSSVSIHEVLLQLHNFDYRVTNGDKSSSTTSFTA